MRQTVLLTDDDPSIRTLATIALRREDFNVIPTCNAEEALSVVRSRDVDFDLLLTDVQMGSGLNGIELADQLLEQSVPVCMCSL
jgi:DNA-binding NtrC family response regulator